MSTAKGIPDRSNYGSTESLTPGSLVRWVVQQHLADRAGKHTDIRLGTPETWLLSWASRKGLPEIGQKHLAVQQPLHDYDYGTYEGKIRKGYGKGDVKLQDLGEALVTKSDPNSLHVTTAHTGTPTRYLLHNTKYGPNQRGWLMQNLTPTEMPDYEKKHFKPISVDKAEEIINKLPETSSVQPKVDGAAILLSLKDKLEAQSYRQSKKTGGPITHTERIFSSIPDLKNILPKELKGSLLRGELYGLDNQTKKVIHPSTLGGLLNSSISKSLRDQKDKNIDLKTMLFDIERHGKNKLDWNTPYKDRMKLLESIMPYLPKDKVHLPEQATNSTDAKKLLDKIKSHQHPLSQEGIVIHPDKGRPMKAKLFDDFDVLIKSIFPGEGKYKDTHAGGFEYGTSEKTLGRVGTGFSDEIRKHMYQYPEEYIGRTAKVTSQEKMRSGALRAPSFWSLHEDPVKEKKADFTTIYRGIKGDYQNPIAENNQYREMTIKALNNLLTTKEQKLYQSLGRKQEQFYTPNEQEAKQYAGVAGNLIKLRIPNTDLSKLRWTYNNLGKPNQFLTGAIDSTLLNRLLTEKKWKQDIERLTKQSSLEELLSRRADDSWKPRVRVMMPTGPNTYLLEKLMNKKYPQNLGKLRFPGGGVDPGETMQEAAVREMQEELKYTLDPSKLEYVGQDSRPTHNYEHYFRLLNHGLKPGKYTDAVGGDSNVYLTRKRPQGDKYFGADINNLIKTSSIPKPSWVQNVMNTSFSTYPPDKIFTRSPQDIADAADIQGVAPKGLTSWQRMVLFHQNRGGSKLPEEQRKNLQEAIKLLSQRAKERRALQEHYDPKTLLPKKVLDKQTSYSDILKRPFYYAIKDHENDIAMLPKGLDDVGFMLPYGQQPKSKEYYPWPDYENNQIYWYKPLSDDTKKYVEQMYKSKI